MEPPDFDHFRSALARAGFPESESANDGAAFGSWWVLLASEPPIRVVWDGKDGRLLAQRMSANRAWQDAWIGKTPDERTSAALVRALSLL